MASGLARFREAQAAVYDDVTAELRAGRKRSHWMWFVFPQLDGLAHSATAKRFALAGLDEARDYLADEVLGARIAECARLVVEIEGASAEEIFGYPDNLKLRSSMTLFAAAAPDADEFVAVLDKYFGGEGDALTLELLA